MDAEKLPPDTPSIGNWTAEPTRLPRDRHISQDYQSLLMHRAAVRLILDNPNLVPQAEATLARWMSKSSRAMHLFERWRHILEQRNWALATEDSELGRELRQASPLTTLLPEKMRLDILAKVRQMQRE